MTGKQISCNTKTFQVFYKKAANLHTFSGVMYSREKLDLSRHRKCLRNGSETAIYNQNFRYSPASVSGKGDHATRKHRCHSVHRGVWCEYLVSHVCGCCSGKTILLEASFGIFKYQQVFINVLVCQLVKLGVIFCEQAQLVGPGLTAA